MTTPADRTTVRLGCADTSLGGTQIVTITNGGNNAVTVEGKSGHLTLRANDWERIARAAYVVEDAR